MLRGLFNTPFDTENLNGTAEKKNIKKGKKQKCQESNKKRKRNYSTDWNWKLKRTKEGNWWIMENK